MQININTPSLEKFRAFARNFSQPQFWGFIVFAVIFGGGVYALGYWGVGASTDGWGTIPITLVAIAFLAGIVLLINADRKWVRFIGALGAMVAGGVIATNWSAIITGLASFRWGLFLLMLLALGLIVGLGLAFSFRSLPRAPRPQPAAPTSTPTA